jgi:predicted branched-subunit amino acid permease
VTDAGVKNKISRPLAITLVAACSFSIGLIGTLAGALLGLLILQPTSFPIAFTQNSTFLSLLWLVVGPILVYSSYNLFNMKKWAAQAVAAVMLFDLIAGPPYVLLAQPSIEPGDVLMWAFDVVMLLLLASAWHTVSRAR